jgi:predicted transcriptional regulator
MTTTTIRLEDDLKARVAAAAEREGKTAHAFILDAIAQTVEQAELDEEFQRIAEERWTQVLATGKTVPWDHATAYLERERPGDDRGSPPRASSGPEPRAWHESSSRPVPSMTSIASSITRPSPVIPQPPRNASTRSSSPWTS